MEASSFSYSIFVNCFPGPRIRRGGTEISEIELRQARATRTKAASAIAGILALASMLLPGAGAEAAELVMFETRFCEWCARWNEEVGVVYDKTEEGRRAPLRRVDLQQDRPKDLRKLGAIVYTPTFVLMDRGSEVGRILGYPGEDHFWGLLAALIEKLPDASLSTSLLWEDGK